MNNKQYQFAAIVKRPQIYSNLRENIRECIKKGLYLYVPSLVMMWGVYIKGLTSNSLKQFDFFARWWADKIPVKIITLAVLAIWLVQLIAQFIFAVYTKHKNKKISSFEDRFIVTCTAKENGTELFIIPERLNPGATYYLRYRYKAVEVAISASKEGGTPVLEFNGSPEIEILRAQQGGNLDNPSDADLTICFMGEEEGNNILRLNVDPLHKEIAEQIYAAFQKKTQTAQ